MAESTALSSHPSSSSTGISPGATASEARNDGGWRGRLTLDYGYQEGRTQLQRCQVQAPLKFQRPFYPEGPEVCHGAMLHTAGGIVGGDRLTLAITLAPQSNVVLTTAAAGKVYRSAEQTSVQETQLTVGPGACLEWLPQEMIVFNGAKFHQSTRVELGDDAIWVGWELTRLGRTARQESFARGEWRSRTEVWRRGRPLWIDRQRVEGGGPVLTSPHGLAGYPVVGSFAWLGRSVSPERIEAIRGLWRDGDRPGEVGCTRLPEGLLCRYRGPSTLAAKQWFCAVWDDLRQGELGRSPCHPRVWAV